MLTGKLIKQKNCLAGWFKIVKNKERKIKIKK
jgi:hypothetical protein